MPIVGRKARVVPEPRESDVPSSEMARGLRTALPDGTFHVGTRGVAETLIFGDDVDRYVFLRFLTEVADRHAWFIHAFCLMGTHYHLVLRATRSDLSSGLHWLNGRYAQHYNRRHGRHGHLFGNRFFAEPLEDDEYLQTACDYVLQNPVRAGLCKSAEEWPWSRSAYRRPAAVASSHEHAFGG
jgi:putative transposase